jgi:hypothetical protein
MNKGFDDIELLELGFKQHGTDRMGEYYWEYKNNDVTLITNETNYEKKDYYSLMLLTEHNEITIRDSRGFKDILRILSYQ